MCRSTLLADVHSRKKNCSLNKVLKGVHQSVLATSISAIITAVASFLGCIMSTFYSVYVIRKYVLLVMVLLCSDSAESVLQSQLYNSAPRQGRITATEVMTTINHGKNWRKRSNAEDDDDLSLASNCPPWFLPDRLTDMTHDNDSFVCNCVDSLREAVRCDEVEQRSHVSVGYCMTFDNATGMVYSGLCPYNYFIVESEGLWVPLPQNVSELNEYLCGAFNREGTLCGHCIKGYGLSVYSPDLRCSNCSQHSGWAWYLFTEFVLQTIFFLIIIIFRVSITTASLNAFVLYSQILASTSASLAIPRILASYNSIAAVYATKVGLTFYDVWNLEFFNTLLPNSCLYEGFSTLNAIAIRYVSAFYPIVLIGLTYTSIELHDRNCTPIVWLWRPFHKCKVRFKKICDLQRSVVHAFATFLLLSYTKVADVSYSLLAPSQLYNASGEQVGPRVWYYDASVQLFQGEHVPYAILSLAILSTYIAIPPVLLFLYPSKIFQRCIQMCRLKCIALHTFMDTFQACYKDGTTGTCDCRYFAGLYFLVRISVISIRLAIRYHWQWAILVIVFAIAAVLVAGFRPYKQNFYNVLDVLILALLALLCQIYLVIITHGSLTGQFSRGFFGLLCVLGFLPLLYFFMFVSYRLFASMRLSSRWHCFERKWTAIRQCGVRMKRRSQHFSKCAEERELPDRLLHPDLYDSLVEGGGMSMEDKL